MEKEKIDFINRVRKHWLLRHVIFDKDVLDFIACQFALESNFGTSTLAVVRENYCGMKIPHRRLSYRLFDVVFFDGFASYTSFDACVLDYVSWLFYNRPYQNVFEELSAFKIFLRNSGYCPERDYISKIELIYSQLKSYENGKN